MSNSAHLRSDRMRRSVANGHEHVSCQTWPLEWPGLGQRPVSVHLTRPVKNYALWTFSVVDHTLQALRSVTFPPASDLVNSKSTLP